MTDTSTEQALRLELAKIFDKDPGEFTPATRFKEDLQATSMQKFTLVAVVEELTGTSTTYGQLNRRKTVGDLLDYIAELINQ